MHRLYIVHLHLLGSLFRARFRVDFAQGDRAEAHPEHHRRNQRGQDDGDHRPPYLKRFPNFGRTLS